MDGYRSQRNKWNVCRIHNLSWTIIIKFSTVISSFKWSSESKVEVHRRIKVHSLKRIAYKLEQSVFSPELAVVIVAVRIGVGHAGQRQTGPGLLLPGRRGGRWRTLRGRPHCRMGGSIRWQCRGTTPNFRSFEVWTIQILEFGGFLNFEVWIAVWET